METETKGYFVDSHAHLTSKEFDADRDDVLVRAADAGVRFVVNPSVDLSDSRKAVELADRHDSVYACVGVHPHEAGKATDRDLAAVEELCRHPKVVAIGEIGLDFHYDFAPRETQDRIFRAQIEIAQRRNLPIVIHTRDSIDETVSAVEECISSSPRWRHRGSGAPGPRGVFHCFSGSLATARKVIGMRFYVSFPGMITFKTAEGPRAVAAAVALDHLLLETDSPYLTPAPFRGERNSPVHIPLIAAKLAELHELPVADIARMTSYNVNDLFGIGDPEPPIAA